MINSSTLDIQKYWLIASDLSKRYFCDESDMVLDDRLKEFVY